MTDGALGERYRTMKRYLKAGRRRLVIEIERRWLRFRSDPRSLNPREAFASLPAEPTVLFLCFGNLCRSPMAATYLEHRLAELGREEFTVTSAGFVAQNGRPSPDPAVAVARNLGVDLTEHGSKRVTREMIDDSDIVFVMDMWNYYDMTREFPDATEKVYFLKPAGDGDGERFEIRDPYHDGVKKFERVFGDIAETIDRLTASQQRDSE